MPKGELESYHGACFLGIDAGSTTTKLALIGKDGELLLSCFAGCREQLPIGYAAFHLPWVLEWYTAARQYKQAYELMRSFPKALLIKHFSHGKPV